MSSSVATTIPVPGTTSTAPAGNRVVLIGTDTYPPDVNGAARFTHRLATGLAGRGNRVHVICLSPDTTGHSGEEDGVTVHRLPSLPVLLYPKQRFVVPGTIGAAVRRIVEQVAPDIIHVQSHFGVGRACLRAARTTRTPVMATNHFMPEPLLRHLAVPQPVRDWGARQAWRDATRFFHRVDHVTTPTPLAAEVLSRNGFHGTAEAISCGVDLTGFRPSPDGSAAARNRVGLPERTTIGFVGRLDPEKRIDQLIRALPAIRRRVDAQLVVAGVGTQRDRLTDLAAGLGVSEHVHLLGFVTDDALPRLYHAFDVFAIAGVAELQSIVTLEAMASGLPVVGADAVALPHLIRNGHNGYLFTPGDIDGLADRIVDVVADPAVSTVMGRAGREMVTEHDHDAALRRFEARYDALTAARSLA